VIQMVKAGLPEAVVIGKIKSTATKFDLKTDSLVSLKKAGVSDKVLEAMRPLDGTEVRRSTVRGQYGAGIVDDVPVKAYREEPGVEPASMAETYIAMQLDVDNWRWAGVPFFPPDREEAHPPHDRDRDPQENLIAPTGDRLAY